MTKFKRRCVCVCQTLVRIDWRFEESAWRCFLLVKKISFTTRNCKLENIWCANELLILAQWFEWSEALPKCIYSKLARKLLWPRSREYDAATVQQVDDDSTSERRRVRTPHFLSSLPAAAAPRPFEISRGQLSRKLSALLLAIFHGYESWRGSWRTRLLYCNCCCVSFCLRYTLLLLHAGSGYRVSCSFKERRARVDSAKSDKRRQEISDCSRA